MTTWTLIPARAFDTTAADTQLAMFAADSQGYTGADLFSDEPEAAAADADDIKAGDYVVRGLEVPARVVQAGAGWLELRRGDFTYRIETMHVHKVSNAR
jgi:hypothetical protein